MPPITRRPGGKPRRRLLLVALLATSCVASGVFAFRALGRFMAPEDTLTHADAIFVLAGTRIERPMEAVDLYLEGYAPYVVITRDVGERAVAIAARRGALMPSDFDLARAAVVKLGVPETALITPPTIHDNTAQEAQTLRALAREHGWRRVIMVSSKYHLRRVGLACRRELKDSGVEIIVRGSRYDPGNPDRWWQRRGDIRWVISELPKLVGYALGVGA